MLRTLGNRANSDPDSNTRVLADCDEGIRLSRAAGDERLELTHTYAGAARPATAAARASPSASSRCPRCARSDLRFARQRHPGAPQLAVGAEDAVGCQMPGHGQDEHGACRDQGRGKQLHSLPGWPQQPHATGDLPVLHAQLGIHQRE